MSNDNFSPVAQAKSGASEGQSISVESFTDTIVFKSRTIKPDLVHLDQERIIGPGATGANAAAYKMLRTQVLRRMEQLGTNTLAVMSAHMGAGKTLTAINLAIAIAAETGRTALLVDVDLRNPSVSQRLGFAPVLGIEDCIKARQPVQEAMVKIAGYDRLTVLPAKNKVESSSELLTDEVAGRLVQELKARYANRVIIFDLPPVLEADDALAFSKHIDAGLLVVREGKTKREDINRTIDVLRDLKIVGTVLNGTKEKVKTYY